MTHVPATVLVVLLVAERVLLVVKQQWLQLPKVPCNRQIRHEDFSGKVVQRS